MRTILKEHKTNCKWCNHNLGLESIAEKMKDREGKKTNIKCPRCNMSSMINQSVLGFFSLYRSDGARFDRNVQAKVNRKVFDPIERRFKKKSDKANRKSAMQLLLDYLEERRGLRIEPRTLLAKVNELQRLEKVQFIEVFELSKVKTTNAYENNPENFYKSYFGGNRGNIKKIQYDECI